MGKRTKTIEKLPFCDLFFLVFDQLGVFVVTDETLFLGSLT